MTAGILLCVECPAKFVPLAGRNIQLLAQTSAFFFAVSKAHRCTVVAGSDDAVILDDDGTVFLAQAGASLGDCLGDIKVIIMLGNALHGELPPENVNLQTDRYYNYNIYKP